MTTAGAILAASAAITSVGTISAASTKPMNPSVRPDPATPGTRVWVYDANECTARNGTATSQALAAPIPLAPLAAMTGGDGTLREGLAAGTYTVTLHCGSTLTTTLRVSTDAGPADTAATADGSAEDHLGIGDAAVGGAFLVGGLAFAATTFLRRRRAAATTATTATTADD